MLIDISSLEMVDCDPSLIAAVLYRDFARGKDDVCVLVARDAGDACGAEAAP